MKLNGLLCKRAEARKVLLFNATGPLPIDEAGVGSVETSATVRQTLGLSQGVVVDTYRDVKVVRVLWAESCLRRRSVYGNVYLRCAECVVIGTLLVQVCM